jgi:serine/threonine protein kinase
MEDTYRFRGRCIDCSVLATANRCEHCGAAMVAGKWRTVRVLSKSALGRTYVAKGSDDQHVVLKELVFSSVPSPEHIEAFERQGRLLQELSHPQLPKFVDVFREGTGSQARFYLVQEFVEGVSLDDDISQRRSSEVEARKVLFELLEVLEYLHTRSPKVIHRDVKPANVIRRTDGTLALVDFDAAREVSFQGTHRATLVGTFGYMPPEQLGGTVDATSDLYALGATLIHLLTRRPPHELFDELFQLRLGPLANISPGFRHVLERMVHPRRSERFQTASQIRRALELTENNSTSRATLWRGLAGGAAVMIVIGMSFWLSRLPPSTPMAFQVTADEHPEGSAGVAKVELVQPDVPQPAFSQAVVLPPSAKVSWATFEYPSPERPLLHVAMQHPRWNQQAPFPSLDSLVSLEEPWLILEFDLRFNGPEPVLLVPSDFVKVVDQRKASFTMTEIPGPPGPMMFSTLSLSRGEHAVLRMGWKVQPVGGPFHIKLPDGRTLPLH